MQHVYSCTLPLLFLLTWNESWAAFERTSLSHLIGNVELEMGQWLLELHFLWGRSFACFSQSLKGQPLITINGRIDVVLDNNFVLSVYLNPKPLTLSKRRRNRWHSVIAFISMLCGESWPALPVSWRAEIPALGRKSWACRQFIYAWKKNFEPTNLCVNKVNFQFLLRLLPGIACDQVAWLLYSPVEIS